jgi:transcriptional regulator with XRE-family HTH domain
VNYNRKEGKIMKNTLKLKAAIMESGMNQEQIAEMLGMTNATFNYKVNNKSEFKASEIKKLCEVLSITEVNAIFFADKVE